MRLRDQLQSQIRITEALTTQLEQRDGEVALLKMEVAECAQREAQLGELADVTMADMTDRLHDLYACSQFEFRLYLRSMSGRISMMEQTERQLKGLADDMAAASASGVAQLTMDFFVDVREKVEAAYDICLMATGE